MPTPIRDDSTAKPEFSGLMGWVAGVSMSIGRRRSVRRLADVAGVQPEDRLLDVGCGPGNAVREAASRGATVVGVDPSPVMLKIARRRTPAERYPRVTYVEGAAERLPFADASFSVVWTVASAHHWPDIPAGLADIGRVLAPGGRLLVVETLVRPRGGWTNRHGFTRERADEVADLARVAGLEANVETYRVGRRTVVVVRGRRAPA